MLVFLSHNIPVSFHFSLYQNVALCYGTRVVIYSMGLNFFKIKAGIKTRNPAPMQLMA